MQGVLYHPELEQIFICKVPMYKEETDYELEMSHFSMLHLFRRYREDGGNVYDQFALSENLIWIGWL